MNEKRYEVLDNTDYVVATGMTLETACILIKGFGYEYNEELLDYRIREMDRITERA